MATDSINPEKERCFAPFNENQIASITEYQKSKNNHPFTCPKCGATLTAMTHGMFCLSCGMWMQRWVHASMANWEWAEFSFIPGYNESAKLITIRVGEKGCGKSEAQRQALGLSHEEYEKIAKIQNENRNRLEKTIESFDKARLKLNLARSIYVSSFEIKKNTEGEIIMENDKITLKTTVSFTKTFTMNRSDYPEQKTVEEIIAMEEEGTKEEPGFIVDGGEMTVKVEQVIP